MKHYGTFKCLLFITFTIAVVNYINTFIHDIPLAISLSIPIIMVEWYLLKNK